MENTSEVQGPQSPCIPWPRPGVDAIQLVTWSQYLRLWATELDKQAGGGLPGLFLANYLTGYPVIPEVRKLFSFQEVRKTHRRRSMPRCGSPTRPT